MKSIVIALPQPTTRDSAEKTGFAAGIVGFFRKYGVILFLTLILLAGVVFGAVRCVSGEARESLADRFILTMPSDTSSSVPLKIFADSFSVSFLFIAILCFLALMPSGLPAVPALVFFRGYEYGVLSAHLCIDYGFSGLAYYIAVVLAGAFLSSLALVYLSQYCLECSTSMLLAIFGRSVSRPLKEKFRELMMNASYTLIITAFSSLTDTLLYFFIGRLFSL